MQSSPDAGDSELGEAIDALARSHQMLISTRQRQANQLRSTLREFHPAVIVAFDPSPAFDALIVLAAASSPMTVRQLTKSKIAAALGRGGGHCHSTRCSHHRESAKIVAMQAKLAARLISRVRG
jgi:hypothetical protein